MKDDAVISSRQRTEENSEDIGIFDSDTDSTPHSRRYWTNKEVKMLKKLKGQNKSDAEIGLELGRNEGAVMMKWKRIQNAGDGGLSDRRDLKRDRKRKRVGTQEPRPKRQRIQHMCLGEEVAEHESVIQDVVQPNRNENRLKWQIRERNHNMADRRVRNDKCGDVEDFHEEDSAEWMKCLQWLDDVGLGEHRDKLEAQWEEDEMDFPTLKRLHDDHLVPFSMFSLCCTYLLSLITSMN